MDIHLQQHLDRQFFTYGAQRAKPYAASSPFAMAMRESGDKAIGLWRADKSLQDTLYEWERGLQPALVQKAFISKI
jgi:hypothetical protein